MRVIEDEAAAARLPMRGRRDNAQPTEDATPTEAEGAFTMRQVVELTGVGEHALRFYERVGLLAPVRRQTSSGHRRYTTSDVSVISTLACLRDAGMSLEQMRQYLALAPQGAAAAPQAQRILAAQRRALVTQARLLQERLRHLDHKIAYWQAVEAHDELALEELARQFAARVCERIASQAPTPDRS